jgi:elongation factor 1-alpha
MISGASQADVALLMVPANMGGFEKSIAKGNHKKGIIQGQTRQHARLCHLLGIEQLIVGVNKMDDPSVSWAEARYKEIKTEVDKMLTKIGFKTKKIPFIPMSGFKGDNLSHKSENMPWYEGFSVQSADKKVKEKITGVTLIDALEKVVKPPKRPVKKVFRMPVSGVYKIKGVGDVITGRIEQGTITQGVKVKFYPMLVPGTVFSIEMHHKTVPEAIAGDNVGLNIKGLKKESMPRVGDVMAIDDPKLDPSPPRAAQQFTALVFVQDHPGQLKCSTGFDEKSQTWKGGFTPSIHIRTAKAPCQMIKINWKSGKATSGHQVEDPQFIEAGDQAEIVLLPKMPLVVQTFNECKPLGRIAAMDSNSLIMLGKVTEVIYKEGK